MSQLYTYTTHTQLYSSRFVRHAFPGGKRLRRGLSSWLGDVGALWLIVEKNLPRGFDVIPAITLPLYPTYPLIYSWIAKLTSSVGAPGSVP